MTDRDPFPFGDPATVRLIWIDLETTGLDPHRHAILEVAAVVTTGELDGGDDPADRFTRVVLPFERFALTDMDPVVRDMHTRNGLLDAVAMPFPYRRPDGTSIPVAHRPLPHRVASHAFLTWIIDVIRRHQLRAGELVQAGSSPHFDRAFLEVHMPDVAAMFDYHLVDVSAIRRAAAWWHPHGAGNEGDDADKPHRAMPDVLDSIALARGLRDRWHDGQRPGTPTTTTGGKLGP